MLKAVAAVRCMPLLLTLFLKTPHPSCHPAPTKPAGWLHKALRATGCGWRRPRSGLEVLGWRFWLRTPPACYLHYFLQVGRTTINQ
jgi:hypothetical protein